MSGNHLKSELALKPVLPFLITIFLFQLFVFPPSAIADSAFNIVGARPLYFGGMRDLAKHYEEKTGIKVFSKAGGCKAALGGVQIPSKRTIGAWCCPVPEELDDKMGIVRIPVAMDAIVIYVHPSNPVNDISIDQLQGIYRGTITNWAELGGPKKPIVPLVRRHCENLPEVFRKQIAGTWSMRENKADWLEVKSIKKMMENVEKFRLAIGYESLVFATKGSVKILNVNGIVPNAKNIRSKLYPFWRVLSLGVHKSLADDPMIKKFLEFTLAPEGQKILRRKLVSIPVEKI
jgi:phosphate transport system substrate-binding protein